jgi:nucleoid DNA-binding protein
MDLAPSRDDLGPDPPADRVDPAAGRERGEMNKTQLVNQISYKTRIPRTDVRMAVETTLDCIKKYTRRRGGITITGFGTFQCSGQGPAKKWNAHTRRYQWGRGWKEVQFTPTRTWWRSMQG